MPKIGAHMSIAKGLEFAVKSSLKTPGGYHADLQPEPERFHL